jgi:hypothetical protein
MNETPHPAPRTPHLMNRLADWVADRANPMLVRCIRQELRSKTFLGVFVLLLVVCAIAAIASAGASSDHVNSQVGRTLFSVLSWAWSLVVVIQAMSTFQAVIRERNEDTWDLLDLTGMGPRPVLRGLLLANLVQGQLYTAALAPFLVMAYLLRGIDLLTIVFALIVVPLTGIAASTLAVFFASIGNNKPSRAFFGGLLGLGLTGAWLGSLALWFDLRWLDWLLGGVMNGTYEIWLILAGWGNGWLAFVALMLVLSGTLMTHRAGDRSSGPRLLWLVLWGNGLLWFVGVFLTMPGWRAADLADGLGVFAIMGVVWAGILGLFSVSEDLALSQRQARTITQAPRWRAWATWFHGPGAARGRLCFLALLSASILVGACAGFLGDGRDFPDKAAIAAPILGGYLCAWLVLGDYLYRGPARSWLDTTALRRGFLLVLLAAVNLVPLLILAFESGTREKESIAGLFAYISPIKGMIEVMASYSARREAVLIVVLLMGLACFGVLLMQGLRLRIATQRIAARQDDRNPRGE